jgi:molecular chaperone DnaK (HSP70)
MPTYGIDLGTTYSCIAYIDNSGRPAIIKNLLGEDTTPSVVYFESADNVVVGRDAKDTAKLYPDQVMSLIKRQMGEEVDFTFYGQVHTPETISALILRDLARAAAEQTGEPVQDVVITVPAYFGVAEREATRNAGRIAGLNVLNLVPEPVAAALHYEAMSAGADRAILVFDLGGGTFDTTVIRLDGKNINVVCTDGDHHLGGADWDAKIVDYLLEHFLAENPETDAGDSEDFMQELTTAAEDMRKGLSTAQSRRRTLRFGGAVATIELSRETLEQLTSELLDRTIDITRRTIDTAKARGIERFDDVLLVGGATRMPAVGAALRKEFDFEPRLYDPDLAVAKGAALFALIESVKVRLPEGDGEVSRAATVPDQALEEVADQLGLTAEKVRQLAEKSVTTVVPRAFGVKLIDQTDPAQEAFYIEHLLPANTPLPAAPDTSQFYTAYHNQTSIQLEIWEQAGAKASRELADNAKIGEGRITGLPPLARNSPIDVTFRMSDTGLLRVDAQELTTGEKLHIELQIQGLTKEQVEEKRAALARYEIS